MVIVVAAAGLAGASDVTLSGSQGVPPVMTSATGTGQITVGADKAAAGQNGPVVIPLAKSGDGKWSVPAGAKLTDPQYEAYRAGNLYVNVPQRGQQRRGDPGASEALAGSTHLP